MLRDCVNDTDQNTSADPVVRERLRSMLTFLDDLTSWYEQVRKLPRPTLTGIIKLGGKLVGSFIANFAEPELHVAISADAHAALFG